MTDKIDQVAEALEELLSAIGIGEEEAAMTAQAMAPILTSPPIIDDEEEDAPGEATPRVHPTGDDEATRRVVGIGDYCVECREDTAGQEGRTTRRAEGHEAHPNGEVETIWLEGYLCEGCQPFEHPLMEGMVHALVERRHDPQEVRRFLKEDIEGIWAGWVSPMLDSLEDSLPFSDR